MKLLTYLADNHPTPGLIRDDARIWDITARKVETTGWTGAEILIGEHNP